MHPVLFCLFYCGYMGAVWWLILLFLRRLDVREEVDIAIIDFSKAFDVVPHNRLLWKLRLHGIEGRALQCISAFLIGLTESVMVNGVRSNSQSPTDGDCVPSGVPQGTVMGPLLFLLYVNDLPSVLDPATACQLFADDCLIYGSIKSPLDDVALQKNIESLHRWDETWGLKFNVSKYNMHLSRKVFLQLAFAHWMAKSSHVCLSPSTLVSLFQIIMGPAHLSGSLSPHLKPTPAPGISPSQSSGDGRWGWGGPFTSSMSLRIFYFPSSLHCGVLWGNMGHNCQGGVQ